MGIVSRKVESGRGWRGVDEGDATLAYLDDTAEEYGEEYDQNERRLYQQRALGLRLQGFVAGAVAAGLIFWIATP